MCDDREPTRVAHLSSVHPWDDNRIFTRHCRTLAGQGYLVTLVATGTRPATDQDGVRVISWPRPAGRLRRVLSSIPRVLVAARQLRADIYHLHDPELVPLIPFLRVAGARVVYDAHEDLPSQILDKHYLPAAIRPLIASLAVVLCAVIDRLADHVVAATPTIAQRFRNIDCTVVHNYPELLDDVDLAVDYEDRELVIAYVGVISSLRGARQMVDGVGLAAVTEEWRLRLVGRYIPSTLREALTSRAGWSRVEEVGEVSKRRARELISSARIGLVLFQPTRAHTEALPTKMFEYMAGGLPVVVSDFPLWREIVTEAGCGIVVDPTKPDAIADALTQLASDPLRAKEMGEKGRIAVLSQLNWSAEKLKLLGVYRNLSGPRRHVQRSRLGSPRDALRRDQSRRRQPRSSPPGSRR